VVRFFAWKISPSLSLCYHKKIANKHPCTERDSNSLFECAGSQARLSPSGHPNLRFCLFDAVAKDQTAKYTIHMAPTCPCVGYMFHPCVEEVAASAELLCFDTSLHHLPWDVFSAVCGWTSSGPILLYMLQRYRYLDEELVNRGSVSSHLWFSSDSCVQVMCELIQEVYCCVEKMYRRPPISLMSVLLSPSISTKTTWLEHAVVSLHKIMWSHFDFGLLYFVTHSHPIFLTSILRKKLQ
jgi:hypothetical protein